jgi:hypothetical protein
MIPTSMAPLTAPIGCRRHHRATMVKIDLRGGRVVGSIFVTAVIAKISFAAG